MYINKTVLFILLHIYATYGLRLLTMEVPPYSKQYSDAVLTCNFDLEGDLLYSVKWYKGGMEFFRFVPRDHPRSQNFPVPGIKVDLETSDQNHVYMKNLTLESTGTYRCEVSAEAPSFQTVFGHKDMIVVDPPDDSPAITGGQPKYYLGETVQVNCTSFGSKPAAALTWYINGEQADKEYLKAYLPFSQQNGLETSVLGLQFKAGKGHVRNGDMKLTCIASIGTVYDQRIEENMRINERQRALESRDKSGSGPRLSHFSEFFSMIFFLHLHWHIG